MILTTIALVVFTLFLVAATANAVIISLLVSLAVAGGFLSLFFLSLTATYIGALSVAAFVISAATVSAVVSVLSASGLYKCTVLWFCFWNLENQIFQVASFCLLCINIMQNGILYPSGWAGFFYLVWLGARGSLRFATRVMGLAFSGNSFSLHQDKDREGSKHRIIQ